MSIRKVFSEETIEKVKEYGKERKIYRGKESQRILDDLGLYTITNCPRYELAYYLIQDVFPGFNWKVVNNEKNSFVKFFNHPNPQAPLVEIVLESYRQIMLMEKGEELFPQRIRL